MNPCGKITLFETSESTNMDKDVRNRMVYKREKSFKEELTVEVEVCGEENVTMMQLLIEINKQCGSVIGCRFRSPKKYEIMMEDEDSKNKLTDGIKVKNSIIMVRDIRNNELVVSFQNLPTYITDGQILEQLQGWRVKPISLIKRSVWPGTDVADGTRFLKVKLNDPDTVLPHSVKFETLEGSEYFRVTHNRQVNVCRLCVQPGHIVRDCPEFTCHKCGKQGHYDRECTAKQCKSCGRSREKCRFNRENVSAKLLNSKGKANMPPLKSDRGHGRIAEDSTQPLKPDVQEGRRGEDTVPRLESDGGGGKRREEQPEARVSPQTEGDSGFGEDMVPESCSLQANAFDVLTEDEADGSDQDQDAGNVSVRRGLKRFREMDQGKDEHMTLKRKDHSGHRAHVDDTSAALQKCSCKITAIDGCNVEAHVSSSSPPSHLKPEQLEHLKNLIEKRLDGSKQALDLNNLGTDPALVSQNIELSLNSTAHAQTVFKIIEENIPGLECLNLSSNCIHKPDGLSNLVSNVPCLKILDLSDNDFKLEQQLDTIKGLKLVELWLDRNPLRDLFKDQASYITAVQQRFPQLLKLDGHDLPPYMVVSGEVSEATHPYKEKLDISAETRALIIRFLNQYYSIYDSGDRQSLLDFYDDEAIFIVKTDAMSENYTKWFNKSKRSDVVSILKDLPKTRHDPTSFTVDVKTDTNKLLLFKVTGVFQEVESKAPDSTKAFSRHFVSVPTDNSSVRIISDLLTIRTATVEEICGVFGGHASPPTSSTVPPHLTTRQQEMLTAFSQQSGMSLQWSLQCLEENQWDFNRAAQIFTNLKTQGMIPDTAFSQ